MFLFSIFNFFPPEVCNQKEWNNSNNNKNTEIYFKTNSVQDEFIFKNCLFWKIFSTEFIYLKRIFIF